MTDRPRPGPATSKVPSSTFYRFEHLAEQVRLVAEKQRSLDDRLRHVELEQRESTSSRRALRELLDQAHRELAELRTALQGQAKRIDELELEQARRGHGTLVATGGGAAGGGLLYGLVELFRGLL